MDNGPVSETPAKKRRGRPPGTKKTVVVSGKLPREPRLSHSTLAATNGSSVAVSSIGSAPEERPPYAQEEEKLSPFSRLLQTILRHDRAEITRVARDLDVAENTVYRWINGSSEPRSVHLKHLLDVLPEHRPALIQGINQTFPGVLDVLSQGIQEVPKVIYSTILDLVAVTADPDTRLWLVSQALFDHALLHLDAEHQGLALTYAQLMPPRHDGIHSLRESISRGHEPWPFSIDTKVYLGSTTLAGAAVMLQRTQTWDLVDGEERLQVEIDEFEASACATPVMRGGDIAGVIIASSTRPDFFRDSMACQALTEYARLFAMALPERDFQPYSLINLRPMPNLTWQRNHIATSYVNRIIAYARAHEVSREQAERSVQGELEQEFEELERFSLGQ